jgi:flagellar biosynthesis protein FliQ
MKEHMDISRRTWIAAIKLAVVISTIAALAAVAVSTIGHVPDGAIVVVVAVVAFAVSWVQTGRVRNTPTPAHIVVHLR